MHDLADGAQLCPPYPPMSMPTVYLDWQRSSSLHVDPQPTMHMAQWSRAGPIFFNSKREGVRSFRQ